MGAGITQELMVHYGKCDGREARRPRDRPGDLIDLEGLPKEMMCKLRQE